MVFRGTFREDRQPSPASVVDEEIDRLLSRAKTRLDSRQITDLGEVRGNDLDSRTGDALKLSSQRVETFTPTRDQNERDSVGG